MEVEIVCFLRLCWSYGSLCFLWRRTVPCCRIVSVFNDGAPLPRDRCGREVDRTVRHHCREPHIKSKTEAGGTSGADEQAANNGWTRDPSSCSSDHKRTPLCFPRWYRIKPSVCTDARVATSNRCSIDTGEGRIKRHRTPNAVDRW